MLLVAPAILVYGPPAVGEDFHWKVMPVTPVVNPLKVSNVVVPAQSVADVPEIAPGEGTPEQGNVQVLASVKAPELVPNPVTSI